jgi:hypothetical protein
MNIGLLIFYHSTQRTISVQTRMPSSLLYTLHPPSIYTLVHDGSPRLSEVLTSAYHFALKALFSLCICFIVETGRTLKVPYNMEMSSLYRLKIVVACVYVLVWC